MIIVIIIMIIIMIIVIIIIMIMIMIIITIIIRPDPDRQSQQESGTHRCIHTMGFKSRREGEIEKYQDLRMEVQRIWEMSVEVVPIIIGALGTTPGSLAKNIKKLDVQVAPGLMQKSVILQTAHIIRRLMDS